MGMSASQARLIALNSRLDDIEYQGQQINQQRTTLSNQINELYNSLLDMSVPTPPSTTDYTKVQYSGKDDSGLRTFTIGSVVPTGKNDAGYNTYSIDFNFNKPGNTIEKDKGTRGLTQNTKYFEYKKVNIDDLPSKYTRKVDIYKQGDPIETIVDEEDKTNICLKVKASELANIDDLSETNIVFGDDGKEINKDNLSDLGDQEVYVTCNVADLNDSLNNLVTKDNDNDNKYTNVYKAATSEKKTEVNITNEEVAKLNLYIVNENGDATEITTADQLQKAFEDGSTVCNTQRGDVIVNNPNYDPKKATYSIGGNELLEFTTDVFEKYGLGGSYSSYVEAFQHKAKSLGLKNNENLTDQVYVYFETDKDGITESHFVLKKDVAVGRNAVQTYSLDADGMYEETEKKDNCQLEFDSATGRITKVSYQDSNGNWIDCELKAETVTDDRAYADAMNEYEYQKVLYDKKQEEINAKTSIIQQQDKNLELKLTRLDNERNAVNTEIESVKKVIQDDIQSSYKTFNG